MATRNEMLQFVAQATGSPISTIEKKSVNIVMRPYLITIVEKLEEMTGTDMCDDSNQPLAWTDRGNPTFGDYLDFFERKEDSVLLKLRKELENPVSSRKKEKGKVFDKDKFIEKVRTSYISMLSPEGKEEFTDDTLVKTAKYNGVDWYMAVYFMEEELKVQLDAFLDKIISDETTYPQLVELFVAAKVAAKRF